MTYKVPYIFDKIKNKRAIVSVPGSKSITARALILAALARGQSVLVNAQISDDTRTMLDCLGRLGIECNVYGTTIKVEGCNGKIPVGSATLNVNSSGTAARFLTALLAFSDGEYVLNSSEQMKQRPMLPLIQSLIAAGANISSEGGTFPLIIRGTSSPICPIKIDITQSSQFLSAMLMAGVCAKDGITIDVCGAHGMGYVDMTLNMMWSFGVNVEEEDNKYSVCGELAAKRYDIEPDVSSACYFYAANKILGTDISVRGITPHSMQGDIAFIRLLKNFDGGKVDMSAFSDQALTLAAIAPYLSKPTEICGVAHIRKQECDRINAMAVNLSAMGVNCVQTEDGIIIYPSLPKPAKIDTFGDHRVAMAFAVTGLRCEGTEIETAEVCSKTFGEYFATLNNLCHDLTV